MLTPEQEAQLRAALQVLTELRDQLDRGEISLQTLWSRLTIETRKPAMRAAWDIMRSLPQFQGEMEFFKQTFNRIGLPAPWEARK